MKLRVPGRGEGTVAGGDEASPMSRGRLSADAPRGLVAHVRSAAGR